MHRVLLLQPLTCRLIMANDHSPVQWPQSNALKRATLVEAAFILPEE